MICSREQKDAVIAVDCLVNFMAKLGLYDFETLDLIEQELHRLVVREGPEYTAILTAAIELVQYEKELD